MKGRVSHCFCFALTLFLLILLTGCGYDSASFLASLEPKDYTVRAKDTVYSISRKYQVPTRTIIEENNLEPPYMLKKGQVLKISRAQVHTVKKGETLYSIARTYGVEYRSLAKQNRIKEPYTLSIGQHLYLPATLAKAAYSDNSDYGVRALDSTSKGVASQNTNATERNTKPVLARRAKASSPRVKMPALPNRSGGFMWPVQGKIASSFGVSGNGRRNDGINILSAKGTPIKAAENGVVAYVGSELKGFGNLMLIKHKDGWVSAYAHADSFNLPKGASVKKGQVIGKVGTTGNVAKPQLHFEIRKGTKAVDPTKYLKK